MKKTGKKMERNVVIYTQCHVAPLSRFIQKVHEFSRLEVLFGQCYGGCSTCNLTLSIPRYPHQDFFGDGSRDGLFIDLIRGLGKPTIHLHGDYHSYYEREADYGVDNYVRISLVGESAGPPLSVTIDVSKPNPITVSRRQSNLKVNCCGDGWPRQ